MKITGNLVTIAILTRLGAILQDGHFVLNSEDHSPGYVDKDMVGVNPHDLSAIAAEIAEMFWGRNIGVVVGPQAGGVGLAYFVAMHLGQNVQVIYAEKAGEGFVIKREAHLDVLRANEGDILVVEDILTTGGSAEKVAAAIFAALIQVFADQDAGEPLPNLRVAAICNRGGVKVTDIEGIESLHYLTEVTEIEKYPPGECPLCAAEVPISTGRGHGKKFLEDKAAEVTKTSAAPLRKVTLESGGNDADL